MIGGGRLTRGETSGDHRTLESAKLSKKTILARLWRYLGANRALIALSILCVTLSSIFSLVGPKLSGLAIDAIGEKPGEANFRRVFAFAAAMAICYTISAVISYMQTRIMLRMTRNVVHKMRCDVFERLSSLPVSFFDRYQPGDIISVVSYDIDTVNTSLSTDLLQIFSSVITVSVSLVMMLTIAPALVLIFAVTVPLSIVISTVLSKKVHPLFKRRSARLGELNGYVEEMIGGQKTTKAYGRERKVLSKFDEKNDEAIRAYTKSEAFGTIVGPSVNFINNISLALVSVFGALAYIYTPIGLGGISSFVQYSRKFSGPINETANIIGDLQSSFAAADRVFRLIDELPEKPDATNAAVLEEVYGSVLMKNVDFSYEADMKYKGGKQVLRDFSLEAPAGKMIAIVGPTGAGKTTIINLLMRFYDANAGTITVDGKSIYELKRKDLRQSFTMVLQDTWLFEGTVYENIAYGNEKATREDVVRACRAAKIDSFIRSLPNGYDTVLTDNGVNISKGQKQLLTIARAMLLDSKMLILDEATSNVDTRTEQYIQEAMRDLMKGRTCFVIAHRLSTVRNADNIIVIKDGRAAEQGRHDELLQRGGLYSELYHSQFEEY